MSSQPGFCQLFFKTEYRENKDRKTVKLPPDCVQFLGSYLLLFKTEYREKEKLSNYHLIVFNSLEVACYFSQNRVPGERKLTFQKEYYTCDSELRYFIALNKS